MAKHGKKYLEVKLIDRSKLYDPEEALALAKKTATAKFDSTVELAVKLGVNPKHADQQVRALSFCLPGLAKKLQ